jgi:hypothetical protein
MAKDKDTIREALPDEYKDKLRQELVEKVIRLDMDQGKPQIWRFRRKKRYSEGLESR